MPLWLTLTTTSSTTAPLATIDPSAELPTALAGALVTLEAREQDLELRIVDGASCAHPA